MKPAARISDMHICPMVTPGTPPIPHVGGPIIMGAPTVLIGMMPAARVGDMAICVGPPDSIAMGSPTVQVAMMFAARMGDPTIHGGMISVGCPTVLIGEAGGGPAAGFPGVSAAATKRPTAAQIQEVQDAIDAGNNQQAIDLAINYYGIDVSNVPNGVQFDATEKAYGVTDFQGNIDLGPAAMASLEELASAIVHETTHANQAAAQRAADPTLTNWPNDTVDTDEAMAYDSELRSAPNTGLTRNAGETEAVRRNEHYNDLSPSEQADFDNGTYP